MIKFTAHIYLLLHKKCKGEVSLEYEHYGGSTTNWKERDRHHKQDCTDPNRKNYNLKVYQYIREHGGYDDWEMVLVETIEVESKQELRKIEAYWIIFTGASLNRRVPGRTRKEWRKQNKEKIAEKKKEKFTCECGSRLRWEDKARHYRSQKHQNYLNALDNSHSS